MGVVTDHLGDLHRRLQGIEDRSAAEHRRKVVVVAGVAVVLVVAAAALWLAVRQRSAAEDRRVCFGFSSAGTPRYRG
ncbi:hypothetical protein AAHH18_17875 [Cellulomonas sp. P4]